MKSDKKLYFMAAFWVVCLCGTSSAKLPEPMAHWAFDEGVGSVAHDSAGMNDGVVHGATWADGILGGALDFDGVDDCVALPDNSPVWLPQEDFTCSSWVFFDAPASVSGQEILLDLNCTTSSNPDNDNGCVVHRRDNGDVVFGITTITEVDQRLYSLRIFGDGEWYHIVALREGTTQALYVNGNLDNSRTCPASQIDYAGGSYDDDRVNIGRITTANSPNGVTYFDGKMDDVRIYDVALSAAEVLALYEDIPEPPESEVYHVDKAGGNDINDGLTRATAFATIGKGIHSSVDGGEVLVWPGVYSEAITFSGKAITVRSAGDAAVIEAPGQDAVSFHSGEEADSVLKNFVIRNSGLGISVKGGSSPIISNLTIVDNDYGILAYEDSNPNISNCIVWDNRDGDIWGCQAHYSFIEQEIVTGPVEGMIAHWRFDECDGMIAGDSAGANEGIVNGAEWVIGLIGGAISFDGADDYVSIPNSDVFDVNNGDVSISMWFMTSVYADQTLMRFRQYDDDPHLEIFASPVYGNLGTRAMPGEAIAAYNAGRIDDGDWHHVAVSLVNGTTDGYKLYLDGMPVGMTTFSGELGGWEAIAIGSDADGGGFFSGSIDDARVYGRGLSAGEVELLYEGEFSDQDGAVRLRPLFANAAMQDYHLLSEKGRYWPDHDVWVLDETSSPCIDGGDPGVEPSGEPMPNGGRINMGAYGGTENASRSEWPLAYDENKDGKTDFKDLAGLCSEWLAELPWAAVDVPIHGL